jgi:hypothetical protein
LIYSRDGVSKTGKETAKESLKEGDVVLESYQKSLTFSLAAVRIWIQEGDHPGG